MIHKLHRLFRINNIRYLLVVIQVGDVIKQAILIGIFSVQEELKLCGNGVETKKFLRSTLKHCCHLLRTLFFGNVRHFFHIGQRLKVFSHSFALRFGDGVIQKHLDRKVLAQLATKVLRQLHKKGSRAEENQHQRRTDTRGNCIKISGFLRLRFSHNTTLLTAYSYRRGTLRHNYCKSTTLY